MKDKDRTKEQLIKELEKLRQRIVALEKLENEHKRAEETLRESEERLKNIVESVNDVIFQLSPSGYIKYVSSNVKELYGYKPEELIGKHFKKTTPLSEVPKALKAIKSVLSGKAIRNLEINQLDSKGKIIPTEINVNPVKKEGKIIAVQGVMRDITERKQAAERHVKELTAITAVVNDMLRGEVDDAQTAERVLDACLTATDSVYGMIGVINEHGNYDTTAYSSHTLQDCAFPDALAWEVSTGMTIRGIWGWPMLHDKPLLCNDLKTHPDRVGLPKGHVLLQCFLGVPLKRGGEVAGMVAVANKPGGYTQEDMNTLVRLASVMSVSRQHRLALIEAKRTSAELEHLVAERTKQLSESEEQFRQFFESEPEYCYMISPKGVMLDVNNAALKALGYKKEELVGKPLKMIYAPESRPKIKQLLAKCNKAGKVKDEELVILSKRGSRRTILQSAASVIGKDRKILHSVSVQRDITKRKRAEEELEIYRMHLEELVEERTIELEETVEKLEEAKQAADEANKAKSDFLANMSHELRTPLNSIIGFSEVMEDGLAGSVTDKQKEYLNDILESGRHLLNLINDILDLSKVEAGKVELEVSKFSIGDLLEQSLTMFRESAAKHSISLRAVIPEDIGDLTADESKTRQVVFNLLSNAVEFTPDGGRVGITARRKEKDIQITVWDTGIGIAKKDIDKLFQPFQQLESTLTKRASGTGLGLNLCKKFVELQGGRIWVENKLGKGSKFRFTIPIRRKK